MARSDKGFQPMLAGMVEDPEKVKFPLLVSPKLDGIRCIMREGQPHTRKLKLVPNRHVQEALHGLPDGLDGELIVGHTFGTDVWNRSQSGVMSRDGEPDFKFWVFDYHRDGGFADRYASATRIVNDYKEGYPWLEIVPHYHCETLDALYEQEKTYVELGYEGIMLRSLNGLYKYGRSTWKQGDLLKWKRFFDAEAMCVDYVERMHNENEQERDERGYAKRSKAKDGMVGTGTLGALVCSVGLCEDGTLVCPRGFNSSGEVAFEANIPVVSLITFELGTGFTDEQRAALWARRDTNLIGSIHKFKYQSLALNSIRIPVWQGERDKRDV